MNAPTPEFNPGMLILIVAETLEGAYSIPTRVGAVTNLAALAAAADLLRAMGVTPTSAPRIYRREDSADRCVSCGAVRSEEDGHTLHIGECELAPMFAM